MMWKDQSGHIIKTPKSIYSKDKIIVLYFDNANGDDDDESSFLT